VGQVDRWQAKLTKHGQINETVALIGSARERRDMGRGPSARAHCFFSAVFSAFLCIFGFPCGFSRFLFLAGFLNFFQLKRILKLFKFEIRSILKFVQI
jgi:hypothetical protein